MNLVAQSLQQAQLAGLTQQIAGSPLAGLTPQSLFGHVPGQFGPPQFGQMQPFGQSPFGQSQFGQPQYGQSQLWPSPWQATGGWAGQPQYSGAAGRGILTYAG